MRHLFPRAWVALALLAFAVPARAVSPVPVTIGHSRDGVLQDLQHKVDQLVGPGRVNVRTDFLGAHAGDPDPWSWINPGHGMQLTLVDRKSPQYVVGWYAESVAAPVIDGTDDALLLDRTRFRGVSVGFQLPRSVTRFGFYVSLAVPAAEPAADMHCSNRAWNSPGDHGMGALEPPYDGDPQMLVYDISRWAGPQTWLVACEVSDAGMRTGMQDGECDHDYSDLLFTVSGVGVTPTVTSTFGRVKRYYR